MDRQSPLYVLLVTLVHCLQNFDSIGSSGGVSPVAFAVPLVVVFLAMLGVGVTLLVLIRMRKRKRAQGRLTHLQSPTMKEAAFGKMRGEDGQFSPLSLRSPQQVNPEPSDPFEFPRNRLYVYSHKVLGMFGAVYMLGQIVNCCWFFKNNNKKSH